ncbi:MAG: M36 family metallopeptidase [Actinomycetota bacterium]
MLEEPVKTRLSLVLSLLLLASLTAGTARAVTRANATQAFSAAEVDVRTAAPPVGATSAQVRALVELTRTFPDLRLEWDRHFGTPSTILRWGKTLTGARPGSPVGAARAWLADHAALYGWTRADVAALRVVKSLAQPGGGARTVLFHQVFGGLEGGAFLGGSMSVALDTENRILTVRANVARATGIARGARLTASAAFARATGPPAPPITGHRAGWTEFGRGPFAAPHYAKRVAFVMGSEAARPAWEVLFARRLDEGYTVVVDAVDGRILYRHQMVLHSGPGDPEAAVFLNYPGAKKGGKQQVMSLSGDPKASPQGWLSPISSALPLPTTIGNNAHTATNWFVFIAPDSGQLRPVDPTYSFDYPFQDAWASSNCGENPISAQQAFPDTPTYALDALPAVVNLFYHHNLMHDYFYRQGFDEAAGNMQLNNFSKGGQGGDPLFGLVQAAAAGGDAPAYLGRDNAYMFPFPDGLPQWSGMFLWEPIPQSFIAPCVDGDFDAQVIYHEYTHGVTSRWTGGEFGNLNSFHGGAMGEAWSDFYAMHYVIRQGFEKRPILGPYVTGNSKRGIRNWALDEVKANFGDIGYDTAGEQVHADGQIWAGILWDLRQSVAATRRGGADLVTQLVSDAMPIAGPVPSMLNMRDAILAADKARTRGANQAVLWKVFARHGMGRSAFAADAFDVSPRPAFDDKDWSKNGTISGRVVDGRTGKAVAGARVFVGQFEARTSPVVRTGSSGTFSFRIRPGTARMIIQAPGYGVQGVSLNVKAGRTTSVVLGLGVNFASVNAGAKVKQVSNPSDAGGPELALNDTASSVWLTSDDGNAKGEFFVVDLAGKSPVTIRQIQVSAYNTPGNRFEALRDFTVLSSTNGKKFTRILRGSFPTTPPRPVSPDLHYKAYALKSPVRASFLKFVADRPQDETVTEVQVADVQAFGSGSVTVKPLKPKKEQPFHDEGIALIPSGSVGITRTLMESGVCVYPPPTQGLDSWVSELPDGFGDGTHIIDVNAASPPGNPRPDMDLYFLSLDCAPTGGIATGAPREAGTIPQGSKYVIAELFTSVVAQITVDAKATQ